MSFLRKIEFKHVSAGKTWMDSPPQWLIPVFIAALFQCAIKLRHVSPSIHPSIARPPSLPPRQSRQGMRGGPIKWGTAIKTSHSRVNIKEFSIAKIDIWFDWDHKSMAVPVPVSLRALRAGVTWNKTLSLGSAIDAAAGQVKGIIPATHGSPPHRSDYKEIHTQPLIPVQ